MLDEQHFASHTRLVIEGFGVLVVCLFLPQKDRKAKRKQKRLAYLHASRSWVSNHALQTHRALKNIPNAKLATRPEVA